MIFKYIQEPKSLQSDNPNFNNRPAYAKAFIDRDLWLMYFTGFIMLFGYWMISTWMPSIYREIGITGLAASSLLSGILGLMGVPGLFISGMLSDVIARKGYGRKGLIALNIFLWALLMLGIGYAVEHRASSILISILFFGSALVIFGAWPPYYALLSELVPIEITGTTFGLANFIGFMSAWIAPYFTGWIKDTTGSFSGGLYFSGSLLIVGVILIMAIRPSFRIRSEVAMEH